MILGRTGGAGRSTILGGIGERRRDRWESISSLRLMWHFKPRFIHQLNSCYVGV